LLGQFNLAFESTSDLGGALPPHSGDGEEEDQPQHHNNEPRIGSSPARDPAATRERYGFIADSSTRSILRKFPLLTLTSISV
jgi:hypothetical protein